MPRRARHLATASVLCFALIESACSDGATTSSASDPGSTSPAPSGDGPPAETGASSSGAPAPRRLTGKLDAAYTNGYPAALATKGVIAASIDGEGRVLVVLQSAKCSFEIARIDARGALDTAYSTPCLTTMFDLVTVKGIAAGAGGEAYLAGAYDPAFGDGGVLRAPCKFGAIDVLSPTTVMAACSTPYPYTTAVMVFDAAGKPDTAFGDDGLVKIPAGPPSSLAAAFADPASGKIVVVTHGVENGNPDIPSELGVGLFRFE